MQITVSIPRNIVSALIGLNIFFLAIALILAFIAGSDNFDFAYTKILLALGALTPGAVIGLGEVWRMITSIFLHVDLIHLAVNMIALYQLGKVIHAYYGGRNLFVFYILSGLGGSLFSVLFLAPNVPTVGASGAVFGLLGVLLAGSAKRTPYGLELPFRTVDILPLAIYAFLFGLVPGTGINNFAHLGGLLTGLALGWIFSHQLTTVKQKRQKHISQALAYLCMALLILSYVGVAVNLHTVLVA